MKPRSDDVHEQRSVARQRRADHRAVAGYDPWALLHHHEREGMKGEGMSFVLDRRSAIRAELWCGAFARQESRRGFHRSTMKATKCMERFEPRRAVCVWGLAAAQRQGAVRPGQQLLRKKDVQRVIDTVYRYCGQKEIGHLLRPDHDHGLP